MGKKDDKPKLSKKERRKLEEKIARKAEKKAAAKAEAKRAKMAKATKKAKVHSADRPTESAASASGAVEGSSEKHPHLQHLDRVAELLKILGDDTVPKKAQKAAEVELNQIRAEGEKINAAKTLEEQDAEMRERIQRKRAERGAELPGSVERLRKVQQDVADRQGIPGPAEVEQVRAAAAKGLTLGDVTPEPVAAPYADAEAAHEADEIAAHGRELREKYGDDVTVPGGTKKKRAKKAGVIHAADPAMDEAIKKATRESIPTVVAAAEEAVAEAIEQRDSTPVDSPVENFARPSEAPKVDFETNGNGQYKVRRPSDGRMVGYTRTTTYISCLEDTTTLTKWKMRMLLEGVAAAEEPDAEGRAEPVTATIRDLAHRRDVAIAKARKADRKGKLLPGQLAGLVDGAWGEFKRELDKIAEDLFELGGGREAATKGTDIHALCDLYDSEGMDAVQDRLDAGEITPADFADVEAYADACRRLGLKVMASEQVIVNDDLKVAGRLDRIVLARLPEITDLKTGEVVRPADARARRYVLDIKTGRVDYGAGKIAQQIRMYAESNAYDLETHERTSHGANRTTGLLLHLPAGTAKATVHVVDLAVGGRGNKLAGEVRAFRNEGKKAINLGIDLVAAATATAEDAAEETEA